MGYGIGTKNDREKPSRFSDFIFFSTEKPRLKNFNREKNRPNKVSVRLEKPIKTRPKKTTFGFRFKTLIPSIPELGLYFGAFVLLSNSPRAPCGVQQHLPTGDPSQAGVDPVVPIPSRNQNYSDFGGRTLIVQAQRKICSCFLMVKHSARGVFFLLLFQCVPVFGSNGTGIYLFLAFPLYFKCTPFGF